MRVIKEGSLPEDCVYQATCNYCKTEIEFTPKEAKETNDQRDGDFYTVQCPLCSRDIHKKTARR